MSIDVSTIGEYASNTHLNPFAENERLEFNRQYEGKRLNSSLEFISENRNSSFSYENTIKAPQEKTREPAYHYRILHSNRPFFNYKNKVGDLNCLEKKSDDNQDILKTIYKIKNVKQPAKKGILNFNSKFSESFRSDFK